MVGPQPAPQTLALTDQFKLLFDVGGNYDRHKGQEFAICSGIEHPELVQHIIEELVGRFRIDGSFAKRKVDHMQGDPLGKGWFRSIRIALHT